MKRFVCLMLGLRALFVVGTGSVAADPVAVERITLDRETALISIGRNVYLKATVEPRNASNRKVEWISSDEEVATVRDGQVKGIAPGTATITARAMDESGAEATFTVTVVQPIRTIKAEEPRLELPPGVAWKPVVIIEPKDATMQELSWASSNEQIATVDEDGTIHTVTVGKCNIVGSAQDDSQKKVTIQLTVKEYDVVFLEPGEVHVPFPTSDCVTYPDSPEVVIQDENGNDVLITKEIFDPDSGSKPQTREDGVVFISVFDHAKGSYRYVTIDPATEQVVETTTRDLEIVQVGGMTQVVEKKKDTYAVTVTYKNGFVCEGSEPHMLKPLQAGADTIEVVTKKNGKKVTKKEQYTVFVVPEAVTE